MRRMACVLMRCMACGVLMHGVGPDAMHGVRRADAWRGSTRCLACGVVMPGAIKREASARDTEDIPSGLARHCDHSCRGGGHDSH